MVSVSEVLFFRRVHLVKYLRFLKRNQCSPLFFLLSLHYVLGVE